jgi:hypothetical protein
LSGRVSAVRVSRLGGEGLRKRALTLAKKLEAVHGVSDPAVRPLALVPHAHDARRRAYGALQKVIVVDEAAVAGCGAAARTQGRRGGGFDLLVASRDHGDDVLCTGAGRKSVVLARSRRALGEASIGVQRGHGRESGIQVRWRAHGTAVC